MWARCMELIKKQSIIRSDSLSLKFTQLIHIFRGRVFYKQYFFDFLNFNFEIKISKVFFGSLKLFQ